MASTGVGGSGEWESFGDIEEVDVEAVIGSMSVVQTVARKAHGSDKQPIVIAPVPTVVSKPTTKMDADELQELVAKVNAHDRATTQLDSDKLRALGVIHKGESKVAAQPTPDALPPKTFSQEHAPVSTIQLDRGYETSLAKKNLVVGDHDEDNGVTIPLQVIHQEMIAALTIPIPRNLVPQAIANIAAAAAAAKPPPKKWGKGQWKHFGLGLAAGALALLTAGIVL